MVDLKALAKQATQSLLPLVRVGLATLAKSVALGVVLTGIAMLVAGYFGSRGGEFWPRLLAAFLVGLIGCVATLILASKRAVFAVAETALTQLAFGTALFEVTFRHLLGIGDDDERGERLGVVGDAIETRVPLAQAERRLNQAVARVTLEPRQLTGLRGWLLNQVRARLLAMVATVTLTRFREDGQRNGAVDLIRVRDELGQGLDALLVEQVSALSARSTWLLGSIAVGLSALTIWGVYWTL